MAEKVQRAMELISEELEEMNRIELFTHEETREILKKRKKFEYDLARLSKSLKDYKEYINYEMNILKLVGQRRRKYKNDERKHDIDFKIRKRIFKLFDAAAQRFPEDKMFIIQYFNFGRSKGMPVAADTAVQILLKKHSHEQNVWQIAARWYAYDKRDINLALRTLDKGRAILKDNSLLYMESISIEIFKALGEKTETKQEETPEDIKKKEHCCARISIYLDDMFLNIKKIDPYIDLLKELEKHKFTADLQTKIVEHMMSQYSDTAELWHVAANRELKGFHYKPSEELVDSTKGRLNLFLDKYNEGLETVKPENKHTLWMYYLDSLIDVVQDDLTTANTYKETKLIDLLERGCEEGYLEERHFMKWLELQKKNSPKFKSICIKATDAVPDSVELWKVRLTYEISRYKSLTGSKDVDECFKLAVDALKDKGLPIWTAMIRFKTLSDNEKDVKILYQEGMKMSQEIAHFLKPLYVEWLALTIDIQDARKEYNRLVTEKPYCRKLHSIMSKLEECEIEINVAANERIHKLAIEQFGMEDETVWVDYMRFVHIYIKDDSKVSRKVKIFNEAKNKIPYLLFMEFIAKLQELHIDYDC